MSDRISPCLWFDDRLEEAAAFYTAVFPRSSVGPMARDPDGTVLAGEVDLDGLRFRGINGLSWQVVPDRLHELLSDPDPARAQAAMRAMLGMRRIVVAELEAQPTPPGRPPLRRPPL